MGPSVYEMNFSVSRFQVFLSTNNHNDWMRECNNHPHWPPKNVRSDGSIQWFTITWFRKHDLGELTHTRQTSHPWWKSNPSASHQSWDVNSQRHFKDFYWHLYYLSLVIVALHATSLAHRLNQWLSESLRSTLNRTSTTLKAGSPLSDLLDDEEENALLNSGKCLLEFQVQP